MTNEGIEEAARFFARHSGRNEPNASDYRAVCNALAARVAEIGRVFDQRGQFRGVYGDQWYEDMRRAIEGTADSAPPDGAPQVTSNCEKCNGALIYGTLYCWACAQTYNAEAMRASDSANATPCEHDTIGLSHGTDSPLRICKKCGASVTINEQ